MSSARSRRPERRGVSRRTVIEEAKEKVLVIVLADLLCGPGTMRNVGERRIARCPIPGHDERTPSFTVYLETNSWFCFGACQRGGDVVDRAAAAWGYGEGEMAMAAADLLYRFGYPIPERPASWHAPKQERQKPVRNDIESALIRTARQRLYKRYFEPIIAVTVDPEDWSHDEQELWEATLPLAEHLVGAMMRRSR
jgi:hypothetical protein